MALDIVRINGYDARRVASVLARCEVHRFSTCVLWIGYETIRGYGRVWFPLDRPKPHHCYAHRVLYTLVRRPIPTGMALHHICHVKLCVNPYHLEPTTWLENWEFSHVAARDWYDDEAGEEF